MAIVNKVDKKMKMDRWTIVKFQLFTYCYLYKIQISDADLDCLTLLATEGDQELTSFCTKAHEKSIFSSIQSVRNCLTKAEKKKLLIKEGKNKKKIYINPTLNIQSKGNILLEYKFLSVATES
jgi:hypothetical protein